MGFYPQEENDKSFHSLTVKLKSSKDFKIETQSGYYVPDSKSGSVSRYKIQQDPIAMMFNWKFSDNNFNARMFSGIYHAINDEDYRQRNGFDNVNKCIVYSAAAQTVLGRTGERNAAITFTVDTQSLFFRFNDGRYKEDLMIAILVNGKEATLKHYELSYSEEELRQLLQTSISISVPMPLPDKKKTITTILYQPHPSFINYGAQSVTIQP